MAEGLYAVDENGLLTSINPAGEGILGWTKDELLGKKMHDVTHYKYPDGRAFPASECPGLQVARQGVALREHEDFFIRKDGSFVPVVFSAAPLKEGEKITGVIVSFRDDTRQRRSREALADSERQLVLALRSSRSAMFDWNVLEGRGEWNAEMSAIYDFQPKGEYINAEEWFSLFHPDDRGRLTAEAELIWKDKTREEFDFEFRAIQKNDDVRWIRSHGRVLRDRDGTAVRMIGIHTDITDRKRMEEELREADERTRFSLEAANIGTWDWDVRTGRVRWSRNVESLHGQPSGSFGESFDSFFQLVFVEDRERVMRQIELAFSGEGSYNVEYRHYRSDGTLGWIEGHGRVVFDRNRKPLRMFGVCTDVTERKNSHDATGLLAAIVASSDDAIVSKTLGGVITSWNKGAETLFGYTAAEAVGQHITLIVPTDRHSEENDILMRLSRGEKIDHFETVRQHKDGRLVEVSVTISPVKDSGGRIIGASKVARDITAKRQTDRALATGARQQKALFHLADELHRANSMEEVYNAGLNAILDALQCNRASILLFDDAGIMRFRSWRGLSSEYRAAVDGHSAWRAGENNPQPVCIRSVASADLPESLKSTVQKEGIVALAFIPLISNGRLIGKFMAYFNAPHRFTGDEIELSLTIARQLAFAIDRKRSDEALQRSEEQFRQLTKSLDAEVSKQTEQVRTLTHDLLRIQDEERRHIARELHDSAGQTLAVLGMNLDMIMNDATRASAPLAERLQEVQTFVRQLQREIRTTSYLLHPPLLDESGLASALSFYVDGLKERSGIAVTLDIAANIGRLPSGTELGIFRLVQECLTNIHRHSGSNTAEIKLFCDRDNVRVEVADQGTGIAPERLAQIRSGGAGVGIRGMEERLRPFGGSVQIQSDSNGTRVLALIPLPQTRKVSAGETLQTVV